MSVPVQPSEARSPFGDGMDRTLLAGPSHSHSHSHSHAYSPATALKRRASASFEDAGPEGSDSSRKKPREEMDPGSAGAEPLAGERVDGEVLAGELEQELQCGCCAALVYRPVVVYPCQHFFCGSCIVLWIKNNGTNCPACRGISTSVTYSRGLQLMADVLVRNAPSKARTANERMQADEIYKPGTNLRIPIPKAPSPEPSIPAMNANYVQPCPHCSPDNQWGWRCPDPIVDPEVDPDNAWHQDDGNPPGHGYCGNCENVLALNAPTTSKCDFCQVSFCGISVPHRCVAAPLANQHLHMLADVGDMIQCADVYDVFDGNTVEVEILLDYMTANELTPRHIYREVVAMILSTPLQFQPLVDAEVFVDVHRVSGGPDPAPGTPRDRICRMCATEVLFWGLRAWWLLERKKGHLAESVTSRPDCPEGRACDSQRNHAHAKEYNHIIMPRELQQPVQAIPMPVMVQVPPQPVQMPPPMEAQYPMPGPSSRPEVVATAVGHLPMPVSVEAHPVNSNSMDADFHHFQERNYTLPIPGPDMISGASVTSGQAEVTTGMKDIALYDPDGAHYPMVQYPNDMPVPSSQEIVDSML